MDQPDNQVAQREASALMNGFNEGVLLVVIVSVNPFGGFVINLLDFSNKKVKLLK